MGRLESLRVFQAVSEHAVESDMSEPDEGQTHQQRIAAKDPRQGQETGKQLGMGGVVGDRADFRARQVAQHGDVGDEYRRPEERPSAGFVAVDGKREEEDDQAFQPQEGIRFRKHGILP